MKGQTNQGILEHQLQRTLRNNLTDAEHLLWQRLRRRQIAGCKFRRQHPFLDYILDFVCLERHLVIELDGGQHQDSKADQVRDQSLRQAGFRVLRFWNNQVLQETDAVLEVISAALTDLPHPHPNPPLEGEGAAEPLDMIGHAARPNPPTAGFAQPAGSGSAEQCSAQSCLRPLEGEGVVDHGAETVPSSPFKGEAGRGMEGSKEC